MQARLNETPSTLSFLLNGQEVVVADAQPTLTLLVWLRAHGYTGTKEGCAEGDCGACTVVLAELDFAGELRLVTINACIRFLPTLHGKAIYTVEGLQTSSGALHPVQQAVVDSHASQCGFCTPGFVMSLFNLYQTSMTAPDLETLRTALSGNLCRCTGYKPILAAGQKMHEYPRQTLDLDALKDKLQTLKQRQAETTFTLDTTQGRYAAPRDLVGLCALRAAHPDATLLAGCTDIGLWSTKQLRPLPYLISTAEVQELQTLALDQERNCLRIGAAVSLNRAYGALCQYWPQLQEMWTRFASLPIRNMGTLGGNVANGSPIGDAMPGLMALGAEVVLARCVDANENADTPSGLSLRRLPLAAFYVAYQQKAWQAHEVLLAIEVPLPCAQQVFRSYKVSKRYDSDISAVCAAFAVTLERDYIQDCRIAFGGMAATPKRAVAAERALRGARWNEETLTQAQLALAADYQPLTDLRASSQYRLTVAQNLLRRFYLETRQQAPLAPVALQVFAA